MIEQRSNRQETKSKHRLIRRSYKYYLQTTNAQYIPEQQLQTLQPPGCTHWYYIDTAYSSKELKNPHLVPREIPLSSKDHRGSMSFHKNRFYLHSLTQREGFQGFQEIPDRGTREITLGVLETFRNFQKLGCSQQQGVFGSFKFKLVVGLEGRLWGLCFDSFESSRQRIKNRTLFTYEGCWSKQGGARSSYLGAGCVPLDRNYQIIITQKHLTKGQKHPL